jgi:4-carboxymuconolactone decarboxylase
MEDIRDNRESEQPANRAELGLALMRSMLGEDAVARITARNAIAPSWHRWTTEVLFGDVWQGSVLDKRQRSLITVAALIPMGRLRELEIHMRAALINGVAFDELVELVQHLGFYAGWPAVGEALTILAKMSADDLSDDAPEPTPPRR